MWKLSHLKAKSTPDLNDFPFGNANCKYQLIRDLLTTEATVLITDAEATNRITCLKNLFNTQHLLLFECKQRLQLNFINKPTGSVTSIGENIQRIYQ